MHTLCSLTCTWDETQAAPEKLLCRPHRPFNNNNRNTVLLATARIPSYKLATPLFTTAFPNNRQTCHSSAPPHLNSPFPIVSRHFREPTWQRKRINGFERRLRTEQVRTVRNECRVCDHTLPVCGCRHIVCPSRAGR